MNKVLFLMMAMLLFGSSPLLAKNAGTSAGPGGGGRDASPGMSESRQQAEEMKGKGSDDARLQRERTYEEKRLRLEKKYTDKRQSLLQKQEKERLKYEKQLQQLEQERTREMKKLHKEFHPEG